MWTSSVCFLCVKTFNKDPNPDKYQLKSNTISSQCQSFGLFSERFLKLPPDSPLISVLCSNERSETKKRSSRTSSSSFSDQFCSGCSEILQATVKLYNELCEVRLKMGWRLDQWEALLKEEETSKPSSKLSSLLHQKLSEQLQLDPGMGGGAGEVRKMRHLLLSHCKEARYQMLDQRNLEVALDRSSVPFPVATEAKTSNLGDCGTTSTSFLVFHSNFSLSNSLEEDLDVVVKRELDEQEFECADVDDFSAIDFEADNFPSTEPKQELTPGSSSTATVRETVATARLRRTTKKNDFCYFPNKIKKPPTTKVKVQVEKPKVKKAKVKIINAKTTNSDSGITCQLCKTVIVADLKKLRRHFEYHIERRYKSCKRPAPTFQCHFCWRRFIFEQQRTIHEQMGTHDRYMTSAKFTCYEEVCNGKPPFSSFNDLEAHFGSVHQTKDQNIHKCSLCQWPFTSDDMRQIHELTHEHFPMKGNQQTWTKTFKCPKCEREDFSNFAALQTHFISEHTKLDDVRIFKCHKCSNSYTNVISLGDHLKTHEMKEDLANTEETGIGSSDKSKYYICAECGKQFATSRILSEHKSHAHKTVQCNLCGEILHSKKLLRHKRRVHKVGHEPQHACSICLKMFHQQCELKRHMKNVHNKKKETGVAAEICHICSKTYQRKGLLHRHLRIAHQIEAEEIKRPAKYVCPECGMGYFYKNSLDNHVDAKHRSLEERRYHFPCTLCSKTFWRKCVLRKHLEEAHGQQQPEIQVQDEQDPGHGSVDIDQSLMINIS